MADDPAPPVPPIAVRISIGADDWGYVQRRLREIADEADGRVQGNFQMYGGGGGGSYSVHTTLRDVSIEQYHAELEAWRQSLPRPQEAEHG